MSEEPTYWAWYENEDKRYWHIYPKKFLVEMCSPDGFKKATTCGRGKIVEVIITPKEIGDKL